MKRWRFPSPAGLALALVTGAAAVSCGDGGENIVHAASSGGGRGGNVGASGEAGSGGQVGPAGGEGGEPGTGGTTPQGGGAGEAGEGGTPASAGTGGLSGEAGEAGAGMAGQGEGGAAGQAGGSSGGSAGESGSPGEGGSGASGSRDCPSLVPPENGSVDDGGATVGAIAEYSCDDGYRLELSGLRACRPNGTWSGTEPTCDRLTCNPISFAGGTVTYDPPDRGCDAVATFTCNAGTLSDTDPRVCTCETGVWIPAQAPTCE
jgi:Sushi repeat (SCR repeat)